MAWRLADAKNRFSELVNRALAGGPQVVLRRRDAVVVARRTCEKLTGQRPSFKQFLLGKAPSLQGLDLTHDKSRMRYRSPAGSPPPSNNHASTINVSAAKSAPFQR